VLREPFLYTDTVSFYNNNLPFEILHSNNILLVQLSNNITNNLSIEQGFLFGKNVETNGINGLFNINKTLLGNNINIENFDHAILKPLKIYKTQAVDNNKNTPLTTGEIISYMEQNGYIRKQMVINDIFYLSNVPNSNLLTFDYANKYGFKKGIDITLDTVSIVFNLKDNTDNYLTPVNFLLSNYLSKTGIYSLNVNDDNIESVTSSSSSIDRVNFDGYLTSDEDNFVSKINEVKTKAPSKKNVSSLFISNPSLNSPVNKKEYLSKTKDYISITEKTVNNIKIFRNKEIEDNDVITIDEASVIAKEIIQKTTSLSFKTLEEFEKFYENICSSIEYVKKDLTIPSDKGYVASYYNQTSTVINHKSFKRLLSQEGKVDNVSYAVDKSSNYFNSILNTSDRGKFIKIAQSIGVEIDFVRDKFGSIFNKLCSLIVTLSYPSAEDLKLISDIDYAKPIYVNSFIVINPNIQYIIKNMSTYDFVYPVYVRIGTYFIISNPIISRTVKSNLYYNFTVPLYTDFENDLNILSYSLSYMSKNTQMVPFVPAKYINTCLFDDLLFIPTTEDEKLWVKTKCVSSAVNKYSILHSNRAINGTELSKIYKSVLSGMDKEIYMCRDCLISKEFAALIVSFYLIKQITNKYSIPVNIDLSKIVKKIYSNYIATESNKTISANDICGITSTNQGAFIDSFMSVNPIVVSTAKIDIIDCQDSEIIENVSVSISEFKISDNNIEEIADKLADDVYNYFNQLSFKNLNVNFDILDCKNNCQECKSQKYIYTASEVVNGKFDLRYSFDALSKQAIGTRKNDYPCNNSIVNNKISYWTFLYIKGKYGDKPTNLKEQKKGINSDTVGKLYYIDADFINTETSITLDELQFFNKKEYGYIATIKELDKFVYYDSESDILYYTPNLTISVSNDYHEDKPFIKINNLKVYTNTLKHTSLSVIDTNVDSFDFGFIYELLYEKEYTSDVDALIGKGLSGMVSSSNQETPVYKIHTTITPDSIKDISSAYNSSGANLKDKGSIASPICEYITNPKNSFIPGHIKMRAKIDAFMVSYEAGERVIKDIGILLPFSFGIIDGYFNEDIGELLSNGSSPEEIDEILNNYQFNVKKYISPDKWYDFMSFTNISSDSIPENKITIDLNALVKKMKTLNGDELFFSKRDGTKTLLRDADIKYGNPKTSIDPGVYISEVNILSDAVYAKAVTKNKFTPIAILSSNDGFKITNVLKESDIDTYKDATYVAYNDISNLVTTIYLYKKPLYNNGIFMTFNQNNKQG